jgi:alkanesulfonate monooxygenase SsuD/methylene tetrahydromethanopterin reductase-like flavin-dependent oxidoreductase (luciferase family)
MIPIAVTIPHFQSYADPDIISALANELESMRVHSLWASDHIIVRHGATFIPSTFTEPLATLAYLASATTTIGTRHERPHRPLPAPRIHRQIPQQR